MEIEINDTFNRELPADPISEVSRRQVTGACFSFVTPKIPSAPTLVHKSDAVAELLGLELSEDEFITFFSGKRSITGSKPYAMCYGGHQFGSWAGQLGDGRAINLAETVHNGKRWAMQLKGAGQTPYSRSADGLAVLRSSIREHLCSEAMHYLGVPTTRSLSLALSGDLVLRDVLYNGNPAYEKGAIVCRVSPTFVRFGNFEIFAARQDFDTLKTLTDYTIKHFFPQITASGKVGYIQFFGEVAESTLKMIINWQRVGFVHGVMNTDNMSILGLTIDYGPYGWLEGYDPDWTPNTTDRQHRRYRYGQQLQIGLWNLLQLANALFPLIEETKPLQDILSRYQENIHRSYQEMMRSKLGITTKLEGDDDLIGRLETVLQLIEIDMTIFFRNLSKIEKGRRYQSLPEFLTDSIYEPEMLKREIEEKLLVWLSEYQARLSKEEVSDSERMVDMNANNPKYVLRNYMAQLAIDRADSDDFSLISDLHELLKNPYDEQPENEKWFTKRPEWARSKVGCSMLSCSS
jgi:serine/tyrosine/threonine adenylyltransferase